MERDDETDEALAVRYGAWITRTLQPEKAIPNKGHGAVLPTGGKPQRKASIGTKKQRAKKKP